MIDLGEVIVICFPQHVELLNQFYPNVLGLSKSLFYKGDKTEAFSTLDNLLSMIKEKHIKVIVFVNHYVWLPILIPQLERNKLDNIKIIMTHQKRYLPKYLVPKVDLILEYAPISSSKAYPKYFNQTHSEKYIHTPFPSFISKAMKQQIQIAGNPNINSSNHSSNHLSHSYLFTGGNNHRDYNGLIKAMNKLNEEYPGKYKLVIAITKKKFLENSLEEGIQIPDNVQFLWDLSRSEFLRWMCFSYAVVLPIKLDKPGGKYYDVIGVTMLSEALVFGKPIIALKKPCIMENVKHEQEALFVKNTEKSYYQTIKDLYENGQLYEKLSHNSTKKGQQILLEGYVKWINYLIHTLDCQSQND